MSHTIIADQCSCGRWNTDDGSQFHECSCGKKVYGVGDIFADSEPEYRAVETLSLDINKVIPFLKENGIENFTN